MSMNVWLMLLVACDVPMSASSAVVEVCNGADDDGDGAIDEGLRAAWYADGDGDGYGAGFAVESCARANGWVAAGGDCDDADPERAPGLPERCNALDDDCDGERDEEVVPRWYADADGDGWGDEAAVVDACVAPAGHTDEPGDCDDEDASAFPGAPEVCDGADQDCDGSVDEGVGSTFHADADGDGYGAAATVIACEQPVGYTRDASDCDDAASTANPAGTEVCNTWVDEDCDGTAGDCPFVGTLSLADADSTLTLRWTAGGLASGDIDGDGYADLVVGDPYWRSETIVSDEAGGTGVAYMEGAVLVIYGRPTPPILPYGEASAEVEADLTLPSGVLDVPTRLGAAVVVADIDGDGAVDVVGSAPGWEPVGQVMVALSGHSASEWTFALRGDDEEGRLGTELEVGDTNGDGVTDVVMAESGEEASVYLMEGPLGASVEVADADAAEWSADHPAVAVGDLDGDGLSDVMLGPRAESTLYVATAPHAGFTEVADVGLRLEGVSPGGGLEFADLDGDGYADLLVGVPTDSTEGEEAGAVYRVPGPVTASLDVTTHDALFGALPGGNLGRSVVVVGDVDGDGVEELAVGAPGQVSTGAGGNGQVYVVDAPGIGTIDLIDALIFTGGEEEMAGSVLSAAGDMNADGYADFSVGADWSNAVQRVYGRGL